MFSLINLKLTPEKRIIRTNTATKYANFVIDYMFIIRKKKYGKCVEEIEYDDIVNTSRCIIIIRYGNIKFRPSYVEYNKNGMNIGEMWGSRETNDLLEISYDGEYNIKTEEVRWFYYKNNKTIFDRLITTFYSNRFPKMEKFKRHLIGHFGKLHRTNGPAVVTYHDNGLIEKEEWYINDIQIK
jgi:hypothetical protein